MFRMNGKVERLLSFDPRNPERQWTSLSLRPRRAFCSSRRSGLGGLGRTVRVSRHFMD